MIIIFGFVILLIFVILISLSKNGKIHKNIPGIFLIVVLISIPILYLGRNKSFFENFEDSNDSLDVFYTNQPKSEVDECNGCPGICDQEEKNYNRQKQQPSLEIIDAPISSSLVERSLNPVIASIYAGSINQGSGFNVTLLAPVPNKSKSSANIEPGFYMLPLKTNDLVTFSTNPDSIDIFKGIVRLPLTNPSLATKIVWYLDKFDSDSFIIVGTSGNNVDGFNSSNPGDIALLNSKYKLQLINQLQNGDSYAGVIYKKDDFQYNDLKQVLTPSDSTAGTFLQNISLMHAGSSFEIVTKGQEIPYEQPKSSMKYNDLPFVKSEYILIKPDGTNNDFSMVINVENNESFVFLSNRREGEPYTLYSQSNNKEGGKNSTYLDNKQPQKWVVDPVYESEFNDVFYIKTFESPNYYLEVDTSETAPKLKVSLYKAGPGQYWKISPKRNNKSIYNIKNEKTNLYLGYSEKGGYLYNDNGSVMLVDTDSYYWKFIPSSNTKAYWNASRQPKKIQFQDFTTPNDFPTVANPTFNLSGYIGGKLVDLSSNGRGPWNKFFTPIWNGDWIYYGTIKTYGRNRSLPETKFLRIKLDNFGRGSAIDSYLGITIQVNNAGSNILFGNITSGQFEGFMAYFEMIETPLNYEGPVKTYPVKMRYLVISNQNKIYNLSSANIDNLNSYSVKFDGRLPAISNFLEMTGTITTVDQQKGIGFPNSNL